MTNGITNIKRTLTLVLIFICIAALSQMAFVEKPEVESPVEGEVIQGKISITGSTDVIGFESYEVYFGFEGDETNTWFLLSDSKEPVKNGGVLAVWDTTQISDGNYRILLRVNLEDDKPTEIIINGLRLRNYLTIETSTPTPNKPNNQQPAEQTSIVANVTATAEASDNPVELTIVTLLTTILKVVGAALLILLLIAAFLYIRGKSR